MDREERGARARGGEARDAVSAEPPAKKSGDSSNEPVQQFGTFRVPVMRPSPSPWEHAGAVVATSAHVERPSRAPAAE